jgi:hypothetical protein
MFFRCKGALPPGMFTASCRRLFGTYTALPFAVKQNSPDTILRDFKTCRKLGHGDAAIEFSNYGVHRYLCSAHYGCPLLYVRIDLDERAV